MCFMEPIFFAPVMVERVWGGNTLARQFGKEIPAGKTIGESWELCDRADAQSVVCAGKFSGRTLHSMLAEFTGEILGHLPHTGRFPLLVKFVDAGDALSVQVHPDDNGAKILGDLGKSECWIVLNAAPGAQIVRGLKAGISRAQFAAAVSENRVDGVVHAFEPKAGDVVALPAGTVHAIGKGLLVAEIQQNSDITFRIWDYNRLGLDGKPRQLHAREALDAIRFDAPGDEFFGDMRRDTVLPERIDFDDGVLIETLLQGKYFDLRRVKMEAGAEWKLIQDGQAPQVVMLLSGSGALGRQELSAGQTGLIPAQAGVHTFRAQERLTFVLSQPQVQRSES